MDFVINPLTEAECKYTYAQSTQIDRLKSAVDFIHTFNITLYSFHMSIKI